MAADLFQHRKNVIREMIYDPSYTPLKLREIAYLMGVSKEERDELKEVLCKLGKDLKLPKVTDDDVQRYLNKLDLDKNGVITQDEFGKLFQEMIASKRKK